jgi:lipopolysaccharide biosynthesis glycosyltransferase
MNILVTTDRNFLQHAYVMLVSLLENNPDDHIDLYYIHYDLDRTSIDKFKKFFSVYNITVTFLDNDLTKLQGLKASYHVTHAAYLRIISPDILPEKISRILYLDPDIIVKKSIVDLYNTDLGECYLAAVDNYDLIAHRKPALNIPVEYSYFNSGVMLIDIEKFRSGQISRKALDFAKTMDATFDYHDQDALNAVLYDKWVSLHPRWNVHTRVVQIENSGHNIREIREAMTDPAIIHFTSKPKPWEYLCNSPFYGEYWRYLRKTPYRGFKPQGFSYRNLMRKTLLKVLTFCFPKRTKRMVSIEFKDKMKDLILKRNRKITAS